MQNIGTTYSELICLQWLKKFEPETSYIQQHELEIYVIKAPRIPNYSNKEPTNNANGIIRQLDKPGPGRCLGFGFAVLGPHSLCSSQPKREEYRTLQRKNNQEITKNLN